MHLFIMVSIQCYCMPRSDPIDLATTYLKSKGSQFKNEFQSKYCSENHIQCIQHLAVRLGLVVVLHGERYGVNHDENEDRVFERL